MKYEVTRTMTNKGCRGLKYHTLYNSVFAIICDFRPHTVITSVKRIKT